MGCFYWLLIEVEWEYVCCVGVEVGEEVMLFVGWLCENLECSYYFGGVWFVNVWGLYDMFGNVVEWMFDVYELFFVMLLFGFEFVWLSDVYLCLVCGGVFIDFVMKFDCVMCCGLFDVWKVCDL